jgi:hypothetical protein
MTTQLKWAVLIAGVTALAGAANAAAQPTPMGPAAVGPTPPSAQQQQLGIPPTDAALLGSLPIPPGAKIINDQSLIIGSGDTWVGRLSLDVGRDATAAYQYFLDSFQGQGWTLQAAVRSKTSLLVFTRSGRSATIEFQDTPRLVGGTTVTLTMAPLGSVSRY